MYYDDLMSDGTGFILHCELPCLCHILHREVFPPISSAYFHTRVSYVLYNCHTSVLGAPSG
jgi:hypothetical protein